LKHSTPRRQAVRGINHSDEDPLLLDIGEMMDKGSLSGPNTSNT
jgi:hypothetical protein